MKRIPTLHKILAGIGCASLLVYVLACTTSFSPDDSQVLYPAFDKQSGAISVAVYDRNTGRSETLFTAIAPGETATNQDLLLVRAQWLDAKHVLVAHSLPDSDEGLPFVVVPRGVNEPVRHLLVPGIKSPPEMLEFPFCLVKSKLYMRNEERLVSVDLITGRTHSIEETNNILPMPGGDGKTIVGFTNPDDADEGMQVGLVDPVTLAFQPVLAITNKFEEGSMPAYDVRSGRLVFVTGENSDLKLNVMKNAKLEFSRPITHLGEEVGVGPWLHMGPDSDRVFAAYMSRPKGATNAEYGVVEIPFDRDPLRWIPLFHAEAEEGGLMFAQSSLSHDGRTWAMATSLLYLQIKSLKPEDCALFLVEVGQAQPKITKVPITPPAQRRKLADL